MKRKQIAYILHCCLVIVGYSSHLKLYLQIVKILLLKMLLIFNNTFVHIYYYGNRVWTNYFKF